MSIMLESNSRNNDVMLFKQFANVVFAEPHGVVSNVDFKGCPKRKEGILVFDFQAEKTSNQLKTFVQEVSRRSSKLSN